MAFRVVQVCDQDLTFFMILTFTLMAFANHQIGGLIDGGKLAPQRCSDRE